MKKLSTVAVLLALVSCGKQVHEKKSGVTSPRKVSASHFSQNPVQLKSMNVAPDGCSVESYTDQQRNLNLSLFLAGESVDQERFFTNLIEGLFVKDIGGNIVSQSHKGQSILMKYVSTDDVITDESKEVSAPAVVTVCPDVEKYEKGTVESAALNATYFISKTNRKVSELLPGVKIDPISVEVTPSIKKDLSVIVKGEVIWHYEAFETDNAYYAPGTNSITFLPHSEEFRKAGLTMNFWEVPMVASHEYGHHIFQTLHPSGDQSALKNCFGHFGLVSAGEQEEKREVTNDDVLGALNEGFADLVSYYSLENNERGVKGVPCLDVTRDVSSKLFANGAAKVFSEAALSDFFSTKELEGPESCDVPNFQDIHIIGAIFANGAERLLSLSTETKDQRLSIVLNWLKEMQAKSADMRALAPAEFLKESLKLLADVTVAKTDGKLDQNECSVLAEIYPGIDTTITACLPPI